MTKKARLHLIITIAVMAFIFIQSAMPGDMSGAESNIIANFIAGITGWDEELLSIIVRKAAHFTEFLILGICLSVNMRDLAAKQRLTGKTGPAAGNVTVSDARKYMLAAWLIGTAYAMTDEFHQIFVPGRVCSLTDVCIDSAGVACGVMLHMLLEKRKA